MRAWLASYRDEGTAVRAPTMCAGRVPRESALTGVNAQRAKTAIGLKVLNLAPFAGQVRRSGAD